MLQFDLYLSLKYFGLSVSFYISPSGLQGRLFQWHWFNNSKIWRGYIRNATICETECDVILDLQIAGGEQSANKYQMSPLYY